MNTITQIYEEHASMRSMPPHDERWTETKKRENQKNLINYLLHGGEYDFYVITPRYTFPFDFARKFILKYVFIVCQIWASETRRIFLLSFFYLLTDVCTRWWWWWRRRRKKPHRSWLRSSAFKLCYSTQQFFFLVFVIA